MSDTTPVRKQPSLELPPMELVLYRLKQVEIMARKNDEQNIAILQGVTAINGKLDNNNDRMDAIDTHLEATDARVVAVEADKRGTAGIIGSIAAIFAAVGAYFK